MFIRLQTNKYYNINEIRSVEIVAFDRNTSLSYIAIYYVNRHTDAEINDTLYYGKDCTHNNDQFRKDVEVINSISDYQILDWTIGLK